MELPAAGWHPDPEQAQTWRYWTGSEWTEQRAPMAAPAKASDGLVIAGYLIALLLPIVGSVIAFVIGCILLAKDRVGHGLGVIALSVISPVIWLTVVLGSAQASTVISAEGGGIWPYQEFVDRARVPTPDVTLRVVEEPCYVQGDYAAACTRHGTYTIWFDATARWHRASARQTFLHELGHNYDYYALSVSDRAALTDLFARASWPKELFADVYSLCATDGWRRRPGMYETAPLGAGRMHAACSFIRR